MPLGRAAPQIKQDRSNIQHTGYYGSTMLINTFFIPMEHRASGQRTRKYARCESAFTRGSRRSLYSRRMCPGPRDCGVIALNISIVSPTWALDLRPPRAHASGEILINRSIGSLFSLRGTCLGRLNLWREHSEHHKLIYYIEIHTTVSVEPLYHAARPILARKNES